MGDPIHKDAQVPHNDVKLSPDAPTSSHSQQVVHTDAHGHKDAQQKAHNDSKVPHEHKKKPKQPRFTPTMQIDATGTVAIVGCGVAGILTALLMGDHCPNIQITVIDPFVGGGRLTSFAPAAETLFQPPPCVFEKSGDVFKKSSLLRWRVLRWMIKRARREPFDREAYGEKCRQQFKACIARHPELEPWCKREGVLHLATQPALDAKYQKWVKSLKGSHDERHYRYMDPEAAKEFDPALKEEKFYGAILSTRDGYIQQERFLEAAMDICRARGVQFVFSRRVTGAKRLGKNGQIQLALTPTDGQGGGYADTRGQIHQPKDVGGGRSETVLFDKVVICAGVDSVRLGDLIGGETLTGEIIPIKGYSITGRKKAMGGVPQHAVVFREIDKFGRSLYNDPSEHEDEHMYRMGGGVIVEGWPSPTVDFAQMRHMFQDTNLGRSIMAEGENRHLWAGLRPATPTNRPLVCALANGRVFINSGHGYNGFVFPWYSTLECLELMWPNTKVLFKGASKMIKIT